MQLLEQATHTQLDTSIDIRVHSSHVTEFMLAVNADWHVWFFLCKLSLTRLYDLYIDERI